MSGIGERLKVIRKEAGLTMDMFGKRLGIGRSAVSQLESGKNAVTEQTILSVCREFGVNENWLRTGEGEPFIQLDRNQEIDSFVKDILQDSDDFRARFVSLLARLDKDEWLLLKQMAERLLAEMGAESEPAPPAAPTREELHEALDRQLDLEQEAREKSGVS